MTAAAAVPALAVLTEEAQGLYPDPLAEDAEGAVDEYETATDDDADAVEAAEAIETAAERAGALTLDT